MTQTAREEFIMLQMAGPEVRFTRVNIAAAVFKRPDLRKKQRSIFTHSNCILRKKLRFTRSIFEGDEEKNLSFKSLALLHFKKNLGYISAAATLNFRPLDLSYVYVRRTGM